VFLIFIAVPWVIIESVRNPCADYGVVTQHVTTVDGRPPTMSKSPALFQLKVPILKADAERLVAAGFIPVVRWVTRPQPTKHLTTAEAKRKLTVN
jgi:hypothetical protein